MAGHANEELQKLKEQVANYKVGDIHKKERGYFADAEPGEMDGMQAHIGVFGMTGAGKSSLINTVEKVLLGREEGGTAMDQSAGGEGTVLLEKHLCQLGFTLNDTRGFFKFDHAEETELFRILYAAVRSGQELKRGEAGEQQASRAGTGAYKFRQKQAICDQVHVVLWVVKGNDRRLQNGEYDRMFSFLREQLSKETITIVTAITHADEMDQAGREKAKRLIREATGSIPCHTFLISNWLGECDEYDAEKEKEVLKMLKTLLDCAERSIKMRQSQRKTAHKRETQQTQTSPKIPVQNTEKPDYSKGHAFFK